MALINCKECGAEVSTKAESCPSCGAKMPKKTSTVTWMVLLFIIFIVVLSAQDKSPRVTSAAANNIANNNQPLNKPPPKPAWSTSSSVDEMTGKFSAYATSPAVYPKKVMGFPYGDIKSWLGVGCNGKDEWVFFGFNSAPNLAHSETEDGYDVISSRIRWDNNVQKVSLTQDWQSKFIHMTNDNVAIPKIISSKTVKLELQWHGEQPTYFEYSLNKSAKAIADIRAKCAGKR